MAKRRLINGGYTEADVETPNRNPVDNLPGMVRSATAHG